MEDDGDPPPAFGPAALGLHRVGTVLPPKPQPQQPIQVLNARGMPARIRKKNRLFFDDDIVNDKLTRSSPSKRSIKTESPGKTPSKIVKKRKGVKSKYMKNKDGDNKSDDGGSTSGGENDDDDDDDNDDIDNNNDSKIKSATKYSKSMTHKLVSGESTISSPSSQKNTLVLSSDRKIGQKIGMRLKNLLKLPKAHKWVSFEWFYGYIDKPIFNGENDFQICLNESFPQLKTRKLTRVEWSKVRRMMGKPRRCSTSFLAEERRDLEKKRQKIRFLQSRKSCDPSFINDLPREIPILLPVGTIVTARLRQPQDGIFTGSVDAVDTLTNTYRITFERTGLGTHSIPDYEIFSNEFTETISTSSLTTDLRPKISSSNILAGIGGISNSSTGHTSGIRRITGLLSTNKTDPLIGFSDMQYKLKNYNLPNGTIGGFQLKLLELIIRTKKTLNAKKMKLMRLKNMNSEAEMYRSFNESFPDDFQQRYASIVIGMEKLNRDMQEYLNEIQTFTKDLTREPQVAAMLTPSYLREKCREMGKESVDKNNQTVTNEPMLQLVNDLAMIMWVVSNLSNDDQNSHVLKVLDGCLHEASNSLDPSNVEAFQRHVQIHVRHIQHGLAQSILSNNSNNDVSP